ncbi:hypothetical protein [Risungbinella massiliensis]|uniref:hypothetical protein n=1 Tax=Risungbinella massiliensis TaxID=1329796 RepID=UPI0012B532A9|nr:hypothetical protein [Risungbinella massiliensis]
MLEQLRALEERIAFLKDEFTLAKERHEFLQQYELYEEWKELRKKRRELLSKGKNRQAS